MAEPCHPWCLLPLLDKKTQKGSGKQLKERNPGEGQWSAYEVWTGTAVPMGTAALKLIHIYNNSTISNLALSRSVCWEVKRATHPDSATTKSGFILDCIRGRLGRIRPKVCSHNNHGLKESPLIVYAGGSLRASLDQQPQQTWELVRNASSQAPPQTD